MAPQECPIYCNILVPLAQPLRATIYHNGSSQWHRKNVPYIAIYRSRLPYRCGQPYIIMGPRNGTTRTSHILQYIGPSCTTVAGIHNIINGSSQWYHKMIIYIAIYWSLLHNRCGQPYIINGSSQFSCKQRH